MDIKTFDEFFNELANKQERNIDNVVHYRYSNKPEVVATVDIPKDERILSYRVINFLKSQGIKFDYLTYDMEKSRYYAMLNKNCFEKCKQ